MKNIFVFLTFLVIVLLTQSCKKDPTLTQQFWECNASQHFDSTKLADKLVGSWQWTKVSSEKFNKQADKKVIVNFTSLGKFTVNENSTIVTSGNWRLKIVDSGILGLSLDSPSQYLYGRILLCDKQLLFNDSYIDGSDNFFIRTK